MSLFTFIYGYKCLPAWTDVHHKHTVHTETESGVTDGYELPCKCWELNGVLRRSSKHFYLLSCLSSPSVFRTRSFLYSLGWTELVVFLPFSPNCWEACISMLSLPHSPSDIRKDLIWEETQKGHLVIETFLNPITSSG